jgi:hypothetical protein
MDSSASRTLIIPEYKEYLQIPATTSIHYKIFSLTTAVEMVLHSNNNIPVYHLDRL